MRVFEEPSRQIGHRLANQDESSYEYLRDSKRSMASILRNLIEKWFDTYSSVVSCNKKKNDLLARLRKQDNMQFLGAFTELFIFILLKNFNNEIIAEEELCNGTRPDFIVKTPAGEEFYVEVTTISEKEFNEGRKIAINLIIDKINNKIKSSKYAINFSWHGIPFANDLNKEVLSEIHQWIKNPNDVEFTKEFNNWTLTLLAIEVLEPRKSENGIIAAFNNSKVQCYSKNFKIKEFDPDTKIENVSDFLTEIKKALDDKAKKYGGLNKPYIIVLNLLSDKISESIVNDAILCETLKNENRISQSFFSKRTNVNGVLVSFNLNPFNLMDGNLPRKESLYFINPNATKKLDHCDFRRLFGSEPFRENVHRLKRINLSEHLKLPQKEWQDALEQEEPDSKSKKALDWMQSYIKNFKL